MWKYIVGEYPLVIAWSCDGRYVAFGGSRRGKILIFDLSLATHEEEATPIQGKIRGVDSVREEVRKPQSKYVFVVKKLRFRPQSAGRHLLASSRSCDAGVEVYDLDSTIEWRFAPSDEESLRDARGEVYEAGWGYGPCGEHGTEGDDQW